jgi:hypothetical protein
MHETMMKMQKICWKTREEFVAFGGYDVKFTVNVNENMRVTLTNVNWGKCSESQRI